MTATRCFLSQKDRRIALALGAAIIAALTALLAVPSVSAETVYDGEFDLYGYEIVMGLIEPDQVGTVEWDFGDGSEHETVKITTDNPLGSVEHTYAAKGDYTVTATLRNENDSSGETAEGKFTFTYRYHIYGYPVVTFDSKGGSSVQPIEGTASRYVPTQPADPTKDGCEFVGWYTDVDCTKAFDWSSEVTKHITLYAGWDGSSHTVSFEYDGGYGTATKQTIADGEKAYQPADPTKDGCEFVGWYLGDAQYDFSAPVTKDITLTAHWKVVSGSGDDKDGSKGITSWIWIVFAVLTIVCVAALFVSGIVFFGFPAVLFAILAIVTFVLYGGVL